MRKGGLEKKRPDFYMCMFGGKCPGCQHGDWGEDTEVWCS